MRALYQAVREAAVVPNSSRVATLALPLKSLPRALPGASAGGGGGVVRRRLKWARAWEMAIMERHACRIGAVDRMTPRVSEGDKRAIASTRRRRQWVNSSR